MKTYNNSLLLQLFRNPNELASLSLRKWNTVIPQARLTQMLGVLAHQAIVQGQIDNIPEPVRPHLVAANRLALRQERMVRWEVDRIADALRTIETPLVLLKGAAYCMLDLPFAKGRLYGDTDFLIYKSVLEDAETELKKNGWKVTDRIDHLNSRYYRQWLQELPPLQHQERMTVIDVHHTIIPLIDKLHVDPEELIASSRPVKQNNSHPIRVLSPADMVLHAATHFLRGGDFTVGFRNLFDLHGMVTHFERFEPDFWSTLKNRAIILGLKRPLFYAMRYLRNYFHTDIPDNFRNILRSWGPTQLCLGAMDRLVDRAILPRQHTTLDPGREIALLFFSHWPLPRLKTWFTPLFWQKRLPRKLG
jgi:hypothetical protein